MTYYILITIALSGNNITTIQQPLIGITDKASCLEIGRRGSAPLSAGSDHVEFICVPVKK